MNHTSPGPTIVRAERIITAPADRVFELIADPARQPRWDGNDNLSEAEPGQRVRAVGTMFTTTITKGALRHNHVVEFDEGRLIAWQPSEPDQEPPGHLWRWELEAIDENRTRVIHTYDWTHLRDPKRLAKARGTTSEMLHASMRRLAALAEAG